MRNIFTAILFLLTLTHVSAQMTSVEQALRDFREKYNKGAFQEIFNSFSETGKQNLPLDKTSKFLKDLNTNFGLLDTTVYLESNGEQRLFRAKFQRGVLGLQLSFDGANQINSLLARPFQQQEINTIRQNKTRLRLPFEGEWTIFWGGDTREQNYHSVVNYQRFAYDVIVTDATNRSFKNLGKANEDYYAYGKPILSPCDATVLFAVDGIPDNVPGQMNKYYLFGNAVVLKTDANEHIVLAHLKPGTVKVKAGQKVKSGQTLGECGNSGNSSEPHLHFHVQDEENFDEALGIRCTFSKVHKAGELLTEYSPVKGDKIKSAQQ